MAAEIRSHHHDSRLRLPLQPPCHLPSSTCDLHPGEPITGFCASCLRQRLACLEAPAAGRKSTSALRSVFSKVSSAGGPSFLRPELRRSRSLSLARGADGFSSYQAPASALEPQRKSCDVRGRSTLWALFHKDDQNPSFPHFSSTSSSSTSTSTAAATAATAMGEEIERESRNQGLPESSATPPMSETHKEANNGDDIKPADPVVLTVETSGEIAEEGEEKVEDKDAELKPMKEHMDLDSFNRHHREAKKPQAKDLKEIASSFWVAAFVFRKKLQNWRRRQKLKKQDGEAALPANKTPKSTRRLSDAQSEFAMDCYGRRSCDTDPRFSIDAGRMSFDGPRFSWDEPRASWDGYMVGGRATFPRLNPMLSVLEDAPAPAVPRSDYLIPVEEDTAAPGGSAETRDYYLDSSSGRRRSLDRSKSIRERPIEVSEPKVVSNSKVSPASGMEFFHRASLVDRDVRDWSCNSLRDDYFRNSESSFRDPDRGTSLKKSRRWSKAWNIWGFFQQRNSSKVEANEVDQSLSEPWPELQSSGFNSRMIRSNSCVGSRKSFSGNAGYGGMRTCSLRSSVNYKRSDELALQRNRSARYSPNQVDNGMLRFYLTPRQNRRRNGVPVSRRKNPSHYFTRSMLGLY